jgi:hypothetical protein
VLEGAVSVSRSLTLAGCITTASAAAGLSLIVSGPCAGKLFLLGTLWKLGSSPSSERCAICVDSMTSSVGPRISWVSSDGTSSSRVQYTFTSQLYLGETIKYAD